MTFRLRTGARVLLAILLAGAYAREAPAQVTASLVAAEEGAVPGSTVTLALRLEHQPGWHTYWVSPGIGEATEIEWTLPDGWLADDIDWPVPNRIHGATGDVTGHGYEGVVYLPVRVVASPDAAPGDIAVLEANASWLMCELELCVPGEADLELALPVVEGEPPVNEAVTAALAATPMPEAGEGFEIAAVRQGNEIVLSVASDAATFSDPHFYSLDELVWHDAEQVFELREGRLEATLPIDSYYEGDPEALSGVFAFTDGAGRYRGLLVNVPLGQTRAAAATPAPAAGSLGLAEALLFAFLGGLILNLMPCVLPVLSMKALSLAQAGPDGARREGLLYAAGVLASFAAIGMLLVTLRTGLGGSGWGFQLQNPLVVLSLALVMAAVGFNLLGAFELGGRVVGLGQGLASRPTPWRAFFTGVLAVVVASPCTAPFMAAALGAALIAPTAVALAIFLALGVGLAAPFLLLAFVPRARSLLPTPGAWMTGLRQALAFPMFATAIWLLWVLGGQRGPDGMGAGLAAVLLLGLALWAFGRAQRTRTAAAFWRGVALAGLAAVAGPVLLVANAGPVTVTKGTGTDASLEEIAYTPAVLEAALADGRPVFAYFTADWCVTCKVNERVAIKTEETRALFSEKQIRVLVGDWTTEDPAITDILLRYGRAGVPLYLYFPRGAGSDGARVLPQLLTPAIVRKAIEDATKPVNTAVSPRPT